MYSVALSGTFDLANYGDPLFPVLLEHELKKRLGDVAVSITSPVGGPYCPDTTRRVARIPRVGDPDFYTWASHCNAVIVGGGDIIRLDDEALARIYGISVDQAVASRAFGVFLLDLGQLAAHVPVLWNAAGVPNRFSAIDAAKVRQAVRHVRYLSVRDEASRTKLVAAGVEQDIHVVPDTGFGLPSVFTPDQLRSRIGGLKAEGLFPSHGRVLGLHTGLLQRETERSLVIGLNQVLAEHPDLTVLLVPITTTHRDLESHLRISAMDHDRVQAIPRPLPIQDVAAVIAHCDAFVGASLHGNITAFAFEREHLFLSLAGPPASKIAEYARLLGRADGPIDSVERFVSRVKGLFAHHWPLDPAIRQSIFGTLNRHYDRLADEIRGRQEHDLRQDFWNTDRLQRDGHEFRAASSSGGAMPPVADPAPGPARPRGRARPSVSAVIPVYNGRQYLAEAIASVAAQTVRPCELIVVDDGSTDESMSVIDEQSVPFPITVVRQENGGQSSARNHGARLAHGDLIALLDQDDRWYPHHIERLTVPFLDQPRLGFSYSNLDEIDHDGKLVCLGRLHWTGSSHPKYALWELLSADMFIVPSASLIRREAFLEVGGFDEQFSGYEDDDLFIRMFRAGFAHTYVDESLSQWRIHQHSTSYSAARRMDASRRKFAEKLMAMCPNDPPVERWWVRDYIAPRFFRRALYSFHTAAVRSDWEACYAAHEEARFFAERMVCGPRTRLRLALMRRPRVYRALYQWWRRDPSLLHGGKTPREITHPRV